MTFRLFRPPQLFMAVLWLCLIPTLAYSQATMAAGSGTAEDPYQITSCLQLQNINTSAYSVLNHDIDCSDTVNWNGGAGFEPISDFSGHLDGQFHQISNLYINGSFRYMGMIAEASGATIANVQIVNADMTNTSTSLSRDGILVGRLGNSSVINSAASGTITGYRVGGLVGRAEKSYILSSKSTAEVFSSTGSRTAGLVGVLGCDEFGLIENSYATGTVHGSDSTHTAGLVAQAGCSIFKDSSPHIKNSYYVGSIEQGGGLLGAFGTGDALGYAHVANSFAASTQPTGSAFIARLDNFFAPGFRASGSNNYWLNTPDNPIDPGNLSKSPIAVTTADYFYSGSNEPMASWDASQWDFSGTDYPKLNWESGACDNGGCPLPTANIPPKTPEIIQPDGVNNDVANPYYTIVWRDADPDDTAAVSLYYDTDNSGADGTLIVAGLSEDDSIYATHNWDTTALPDGNYYIYAVVDDGVNTPVVAYSDGVVEKNSAVSVDDIAMFANYDGGTFTVDVDQPVKKLGFIAYKPMTITITGIYASDIEKVEITGHNVHSVSGIDAAKISQRTRAQATLTDLSGSSSMGCAYGKGTTGGCNTYPQAKDYFETKLGGLVRFEKLDYDEFSGTIAISDMAIDFGDSAESDSNVVINDSQTSTVTGENFNFNFVDLPLSDGTGGTLVIRATGDFAHIRLISSGEHYTWDMDGIISGGPVGNFVSTDDVTIDSSEGGPFDFVNYSGGIGTIDFQKTYVLDGATLNSILSDREINFFVDLADGVSGSGNTIDVTISYTEGTPNTLPIADSLVVTGTLQQAYTLTATYGYSDPDNSPESGSTYRWQRADNDSGDNTVTISDTTTKSYTLAPADIDKYVRFCVTPSDGTKFGTEVCSHWYGGVVVDAQQTCMLGSVTFDEVGEHAFVVPIGCDTIQVKTWGAGGGGIMAEPWGTSNGGNGGYVEAQLPVSAGEKFRVIVPEGGKHAACGGGTNGAGGGGHASLLRLDYSPLISAGGGGGAQFYTESCHGGANCSLPAYQAGGMGYGGGGERSDATATDGQPGSGFPNFAGGAQGGGNYGGLGNCGGDEGRGGYGSGGGGGGTHNGFGGGGGGSGYPGGAGGIDNSAGHGGSNYVDAIATLLISNSNGALGGIGENDGSNGKVEITWSSTSVPIADNVSIDGLLQEGSILTGSYTFTDPEGDSENSSTYRWQRADNYSGDNTVTISGATVQSYTLVAADVSKYVRFCVTPSDGVDSRTEVCSGWLLVSADDTGIPRFSLNKAGNGFGTYRVKPTAQTEWTIHCRTACDQASHDFPVSTELTLVANARAGSQFTGWQCDNGLSSERANWSLILDESISCTATYTARENDPNFVTFTGQIIGTGNGTVSVSGTQLSTQNTITLPIGDSVWISAKPTDVFSQFAAWSGDCAGNKAAFRLTMDSDKTCYAEFTSAAAQVADDIVTQLYANENFAAQYPQSANAECLQEAMHFAVTPMRHVQSHLQVSGVWPTQFDDIEWYQPLNSTCIQALKLVSNTQDSALQLSVSLQNNAGQTEAVNLQAIPTTGSGQTDWEWRW